MNEPDIRIELLKCTMVGLVIFFIGTIIVASIILLFFPKEPITPHIPHYMTLRDNLTMPDGRTYWDNNNATDVVIATRVLEDYVYSFPTNQSNIIATIEKSFNHTPSGEFYEAP